ncbi:hypothetical protein FHS27_001008 [Rhodopirellula rubra]|uniref:Uncharacterized protein n=1 Tax=Aporhodopirellula rubra TaxID=980271 RepID=A0A7W5H4I8_9BACT|nr:hypothetical protein [Aporhodopirellula rubra]
MRASDADACWQHALRLKGMHAGSVRYGEVECTLAACTTFGPMCFGGVPCVTRCSETREGQRPRHLPRCTGLANDRAVGPSNNVDRVGAGFVAGAAYASLINQVVTQPRGSDAVEELATSFGDQPLGSVKPPGSVKPVGAGPS